MSTTRLTRADFLLGLGLGLLTAPLGCDHASGAASPMPMKTIAASAWPIPRGAAVAPPPALVPVPFEDLCITSGGGTHLTAHRYGVDQPTTRAVLALPGADEAELAFTLHGGTLVRAALGSGEVREAVGLKLRAEDTCNVVYVMWRVSPSPGIYVSLKRNAGMTTHEQCHDGGYVNVRPAPKATETLVVPAPLAYGSSHVLRAAIDGDRLRAWADGELAWAGDLPAEAHAVHGPVGFRSDDVRVDVELRVPAAAAHAKRSVCPAGMRPAR